jgi:two-component system response regulator RegX3
VSSRILLADDEVDLLDSVRYALTREGFAVDTVKDGAAALEAARASAYDLLILDVMMPRLSGQDVCRTVRAESDVPIIMLTARDSELDRVLGLELGADDYVVKPFSLAELVSRVRALLRRRRLDLVAAGGSAIVVGGIRIEPTSHQVTIDDEDVHLTPSEYKLLLLLASSPGQVFTRTQIMEHLWQTTFVGDARACDVHVANLRRKIEPDSRRPQRIVTVREAGYKLVDV